MLRPAWGVDQGPTKTVLRAMQRLSQGNYRESMQQNRRTGEGRSWTRRGEQHLTNPNRTLCTPRFARPSVLLDGGT